MMHSRVMLRMTGDTFSAQGEARRVSAQTPLYLRVRKRNVLRIGFGLVTALLAFSLFQAYKIQASLSDETVQIYHRHVQQDDLLARLRRVSWIGTTLSKDYLVYSEGTGAGKFAAEMAKLKADSLQLVDEVNKLPGIPRGPQLTLRVKL